MEVLGSLEKERISPKPKSSSRGVLVQLLATGFGVGYLPWAPGTWGSLFAVLILLGIYQFAGGLSFVLHFLLTILLFPLACVTAGRLARQTSRHDPTFIVIDEIFGQFLTLLWLPPTIVGWGLAFALFRFFDIVKPFPARRSERLPGGLGIVADDLLAGLYAGLLVWLIYAR
jgi:phosphatidylglycerophosphatase A